MKTSSAAPIRPTLASFLAAFGPSKGPRLWAFLVTLSLLGRENLQAMGVTRTAVFKNLRELTTHPALAGMKLLGHHVRGRAAGELVRDLVADLVEAAYEGHLSYREFLDLREILHSEADNIEETFRARAAQGPLAITLEPPKLARKPKTPRPPKARPPLSGLAPSRITADGDAPASPTPRRRKKKAGTSHLEIGLNAGSQNLSGKTELIRCVYD